MKQDVTVEGIPTNMNVNHNHNVVFEIQISEATAGRIKDIAITVFTIAATTAIAKSLAGTANRMLLDQNHSRLEIARQIAADKSYYELWGKK
jgi:hypothetical protein